MRVSSARPELWAQNKEFSRADATLIIETVPCGVVQASTNGAILQANAIAQDILGLSWDPLSACYVTVRGGEILWEDGSRCLAGDYPISKCLATGLPQPAATIGFRRPDGAVVWTTFTAAPLVDPENGRLTGVLATFLDITERKRGEEARRESEENYHSLYSSMNEGVALHEVIYDESGAPIDYTILDVNPAYESILEVKREQVAGKKASTLYGTNSPPNLDVYAMVAATGQPVSFQTTFAPKQKSFRISVFSPSKGKFATIFEDITERLRLEVELVQAQRLEGIGRLAGGVAHDFNNLLTAINGYSHSLLHQLPLETPMREKLEQIKRAGERAASLTHQLLAFSRKQLLQPRVLELNALVANIDKMLRRLIGEDVELVTVFGRKLGRIKADPTQLEQVLLNLVVNARDAMPDGGKIIIETANVDLDSAYAIRHVAVTPGRYVMLAVTDVGCGIDATTLKHIFEPFYTTKEQGKGTGLGLSTVYGIVKQSGGNIWVYTEVGRGTTFKIYLPRVEEAVTGTKPDLTPNSALGGTETILLVEDEDLVRNFVRGFLEEKGYNVLEAHHGTEALRIAIQHSGHIHLLLTDLVMPHMSGKMLARRLSPLRPGIRVLLMSGYSENASLHQGTLDVGTAFIEKPFTVESLARKVREVLDAHPRS